MTASERSGRGRPGRVERAPKKVRKHVDRRLRQGGHYDEIIAETKADLEAAGEGPFSKSSLHRYAQKTHRSINRVKRAWAVADAWVPELDEEGAGNITKLTIEMMRTMIYDALLCADHSEDESGALPARPDTELVSRLALALKRLESAAQLNERREREIRATIADDVEKATKGLKTGTAQKLRDMIVGQIRDQ